MPLRRRRSCIHKGVSARASIPRTTRQTYRGQASGASSLTGLWETADWAGAGPRNAAATHLPLTDKGLAAASGFSNDHNPMLECIPGIPPGNMGGPYLHRMTLGDGVATKETGFRTALSDTRAAETSRVTSRGEPR